MKHSRNENGIIPLTVFLKYLGERCTLVVKGSRMSGKITAISSGTVELDFQKISQTDIDGIE